MSMRLDDRARPFLSPALYGPPEIPEPPPMSPTAAGAALAWSIGNVHNSAARGYRDHMREWLCQQASDEVLDAINRYLLDPVNNCRAIGRAHAAAQHEAVKILEEE